jgi:hypothetical protein
MCFHKGIGLGICVIKPFVGQNMAWATVILREIWIRSRLSCPEVQDWLYLANLALQMFFTCKQIMMLIHVSFLDDATAPSTI